jgi:membrane protease YdiL (CAAX protease family)
MVGSPTTGPPTTGSAPSHSWPPTADPQGVSLSTGAVLLVVTSMTLLTYIATWSGPKGQGWTPHARWHIVVHGVELLLWLGIVIGLGWRRAAGLVGGRVSGLGLVALVALWSITLMAAGTADVSSTGLGTVGLLFVSTFFGAFGEEVAFRGFVYQGLTVRIGGTLAVVLGSAAFSVYHLPKYLVEQDPDAPVVWWLVDHFLWALFICRVRARSGSVWLSTGLHVFWNFLILGHRIWGSPSGGLWEAFVYFHAAVLLIGLGTLLGLAVPRLFSAARRDLKFTMALARIRGVTDAGIIPAGASRLRSIPAPTDSFERFSPAARTTVAAAQAVALARADDYIGTEHLAVALLADGDAVVTRALCAAGLPEDRPRTIPEPGPAERPALPLSPRAVHVLRRAVLVADDLRDATIAPGHLFMALLEDAPPEPIELAKRLGFDPAVVRAEVARCLTERNGRSPRE